MPGSQHSPALPDAGARQRALLDYVLYRENTGNFIGFGLGHAKLTPKRPS
jgi:hypothetical protein